MINLGQRDEPLPPAQEVTNCISLSTPDNVSDETIGCFIGLINNSYAQFVACFWQHKTNLQPEQALTCADALDELRRPVSVFRCVITAEKENAILKTCGTVIEPSLSAVATCLQIASNPVTCLPTGGPPSVQCLRRIDSNLDGLMARIEQTVPELALLKVVHCAVASNDVPTVVTVCLAGRFPDAIRRTVACVMRQTDRNGIESCAASALLADDNQRILGCALGAEGSYAQFGLCIVGIKLKALSLCVRGHKM